MTATSKDTHLSPREIEALATFYRATFCSQKAENLEKGWAKPTEYDRQNLEAIRAAHAVLTPMKVAA